jgi:hypothetical protein
MTSHDELSGAALLGAAYEDVLAVISLESELEALRAARGEWDQRRGRVYEDEDLWELWTQGFLEWYAVERISSDEDYPPAARLIAGSDPHKADALRAWMRSHRTLLEIIAIAGDRVEAIDLLGGAELSILEKRTLHGVDGGEIVEVRVVACGEDVHFGRSMCFHPQGTRAAIVDHARRMIDSGSDRRDVMDFCGKLRLRSERYGHMPAIKVYETTRPEDIDEALLRGRR